MLSVVEGASSRAIVASAFGFTVGGGGVGGVDGNGGWSTISRCGGELRVVRLAREFRERVFGCTRVVWAGCEFRATRAWRAARVAAERWGGMWQVWGGYANASWWQAMVHER